MVAARVGEPLAFFVSMQGRRLGRGALEGPFKQLLGELGLYRSYLLPSSGAVGLLGASQQVGDLLLEARI